MASRRSQPKSQKCSRTRGNGSSLYDDETRPTGRERELVPPEERGGRGRVEGRKGKGSEGVEADGYTPDGGEDSRGGGPFVRKDRRRKSGVHSINGTRSWVAEHFPGGVDSTEDAPAVDSGGAQTRAAPPRPAKRNAERREPQGTLRAHAGHRRPSRRATTEWRQAAGRSRRLPQGALAVHRHGLKVLSHLDATQLFGRAAVVA